MPGAALPPDVAQQAHAQSMGVYRESFERRRLLGFIIVYSIFAFIFLIIVLAVAFSGGDASGRLAVTSVFGVIFLFFAAVAIWALMNSPVVSAAARDRRIYAFDDGYVQVTRKGPVGRRWDSVSKIYQSVIQRRVYGIPAGTMRVYRLTFSDGSTVKLTDNSIDLATFGPVLMREVSRAQVPRAGAALQAGQTLHFGDFSISQQGVSIKGKPPIAWSSVKKVDVSAGYVRVLQDGKWLATTRLASNVPNLYTFITLTDHMASSAV